MARIGIVVVAAVLAVAWFVWTAGEEPVPPPPVAANQPGAVEPAATQEASLPAPAARATGQDSAWWSAGLANPEASVVEAAADDSRAGVLRGRLTVRQQLFQHPAGVEVRLTRSWLDSVIPVETEPGQRTPLRDELRTSTDAHGYFVFRIVPPPTELFFLIGHRTEWQDYQKVPKLPRAGETIDLGDVFVDQRGAIEGYVTKHGQGLANAVVRAVDDPLLDGTSGFEELLEARQLGLESYQPTGMTRGGPIPDWVARRDRFLPFPTATTDAEGKFVLRGVRPGNHNLFVRETGRFGNAIGRSDGVLVAAGQTTDLGVIDLRSESPLLRLRFVDEDKQPWANARVALLSSITGFGGEPTTTGADGSVLLASPDPQARLLFGMPDGGPWLEVARPSGGRVRELSRDRVTPPATVTVPRPRELVVTLVDSGERLLAGGTVRAYVQAETFRPVDRLLPAGLQPRQREPGIHVGRLPCPAVLVASVPGFAPAMTTASSGRVTMKLLPLQTATVRVHDLDGRSIAGATVRAQVHGHPELRFVGAQWSALANDRVLVGTTDEQGELTVPVWPTFFSFQASHRDFAPSAGPKVLPVPGERIDLLLRGGAEVRGTLTIEMRPAPAGLRVRARQRPPDGHELATSGFLDERLAVTGADGTFSFRQLVAGIWELCPELPGVPTADGPQPGAQPWRNKRVQLDEGQELHTTIEIQQDYLAPTQVRGVVTCNGAALAGALVRLRRLDPPDTKQRNDVRRRFKELGDRESLAMLGPEETTAWLRCETDAFGEFRFRDLAPNTEHELRVDVPQGGRLQFVGRRVLRSGTTTRPTEADFAMTASDVRITCLQEGRPLPNRMLRLRQVVDKETEGARFEVLLDANGQAWIEQLPIGRWTVEPMHGGSLHPAEFAVGANLPVAPLLQYLPR